ncbi:hypothetical protein [Dyadobacter sp. LHD-138]|uniref:hypothetical protein n=1 Tax=Dyadobacter sp. LHD-138 TaxID=3071413 RepID=UPI0027E1E543|nr:hypothetical protein [Dyadobacter sp. LHD-138]MDQ6479994.1 hypothetical protein [Dyadobacter sp. LHD-138]
MKSEIGVLTKDEKLKINDLLVNNTNYIFQNLEMLLSGEIGHFIESREHILKIYAFRLKNTKRDNLKKQLEWLVNNLMESSDELIRASFIGPAENRIMIFSDIYFTSLLGVVSKDDSQLVKSTT